MDSKLDLRRHRVPSSSALLRMKSSLLTGRNNFIHNRLRARASIWHHVPSSGKPGWHDLCDSHARPESRRYFCGQPPSRIESGELLLAFFQLGVRFHELLLCHPESRSRKVHHASRRSATLAEAGLTAGPDRGGDGIAAISLLSARRSAPCSVASPAPSEPAPGKGHSPEYPHSGQDQR